MNVLWLALEEARRAAVLRRLVHSVSEGDADAFASALSGITWEGGWADGLRVLKPLGPIPEAIQVVFETAWNRGSAEKPSIRRFLALDLIGHDRLLVEGLGALLPPRRPDQTPATLYQVVSSADAEAGRAGAWWTQEADFAPMLSVMTADIEMHTRDRRLIATEAPADAFIYARDDDPEIVLDPSRLGTVSIAGIPRTKNGNGESGEA